MGRRGWLGGREVVGLLHRRLVGLFEARCQIVSAAKGGLVGGYVEGSLVVQIGEEARFGLLELLLPGQDLRHRRIWQSLSGPTLACTHVAAQKLENVPRHSIVTVAAKV